MELTQVLSFLLLVLFPTALTAAPVDSDRARSGLRKENGAGMALEMEPETETDETKAYIVTFAHDDEDTSKKAYELCKLVGGSVRHTYENVPDIATMNLPPQAVEALRNNDKVLAVEENSDFHASAWVNSWGQDRIDQCESSGRITGTTFTKKDASSVRIYILDTGIRGTHKEFTNVIDSDCHHSFIEGEPDPLQDGSGHGTHVASTSCGQKYGVVNCGELCAVKVLSSNGGGTAESIIDGLDFAAGNCPTGKQCVVNMSLGGKGQHRGMSLAVQNTVDQGHVVVVAAGNEGDDACGYTPSFVPDAITVGAIDRYDNLPSFTNKGRCVDIYAPGVYIKAAGIDSDRSTARKAGTSMAAPHVAGIAAAKLHEGADPKEVADLLKNDVSFEHVDCDCQGTGVATIGGLGCREQNPECPTYVEYNCVFANIGCPSGLTMENKRKCDRWGWTVSFECTASATTCVNTGTEMAAE